MAAAFVRLSILLGSLALVSSASSITINNTPSEYQNQGLLGATEEMQRANYFTFVTLINMASLDSTIQANVTFLMPNDRMLSRNVMAPGSVSAFLLRHSIPSPLLFDDLERLPTGSIIPSSLPDCMLRISNNGRRNFSLNNVKIISPNICTAGSSIRCHGIDGVLLPTSMPENNTTSPSSSCSNSSSPPVAGATSPAPSSPSLTAIAAAPSPTQPSSSPQKPGPSPWLSYGGTLQLLVTSLMVLIVGSI
ncbi:FAS1 domain-containing protein SELMODRAFT_448915 [Alnus glutinosa]|uniref:FAS1 domain-containing protein SELMODRAFT_448915 n=1 Tax=Alnus glutinosa TaxID=3517 RepID=UPI002D799DA7|nr:FAS1 domain-containing protein SELMODRAFT_448915 [Alnus glutinosa]